MGKAGTAPPAPPAAPLLGALLFCDLVDSTHLTGKLGDARAAELLGRHDQAARSIAREFLGRELNQSDGFLFRFELPIQAVRFALRFHRALLALTSEFGVRFQTRIGIHVGEVHIAENTDEEVAQGALRLRPVGIAIPTTARVMSLAAGGQTLLTRAAFDLARRASIGDNAVPADVQWLAHGPYLFKGIEEPLEVFEVGEPGIAPLQAPADTEKARRAIAAGDEVTLGWRPAAGLSIPGRPDWVLHERLGEGGFGEVWLARNDKTGLRHVFKFCFEAERLRGLKREAALFRLLRETLGERDDIAQILEWQFDSAPFFLESEFTEGGSLVDWSRTQGGVGTLPMAERLEIMSRVALALSAAHSVAILHRDVKPSNILVSRRQDGTLVVRLADFGIGTVMDQAILDTQSAAASAVSDLMTGSLESSRTGTRIYMAPERLEGKAPTIQSDIYSLGVMLYQVAVGQLGRPLAPGWEGHIRDPILREDIAACVHGDPERRLASARELADRLGSLHRRRRARWLRRALRTLAATAVVLAVVAGFLLQAYRRETRLKEGQAAARRTAENLMQDMMSKLLTGLRSIRRTDLLEPAARMSLDYYQELAPDWETTTTLKQKAGAWENLAIVLEEKGDTPGALADHGKALDLRLGLLRDIPGNHRVLNDVAISRENRARLFRSSGRAAEATAETSEVLQVREKLVTLDPNRAEYLVKLAGLYRALADDRGTTPRQGMVHRGRASELVERAMAVAPRDPTVLREAGLLSESIGMAAENALHLDDALPMYSRAEGLLNEALKEDPGNLWIVSDILHVLTNRADVERKQGKPMEAVESYRKVLAEQERQDRMNPGSLKLLLPIGQTRQRLTRALRQGARFDEAIPASQGAEAIYTQVEGLDPSRRPRYERLIAATQIERVRALQGLHRDDEATSLGLQVLARLKPLADSNRPDTTDSPQMATLLIVLKRVNEARPYALKALSGQADPEFVELCRSVGITAPAPSSGS